MASFKSFDELLKSPHKYSVIYADPPWDFSNSNVQKAKAEKSNVKDHYLTAGLPALKAMPVKDVVALDAALLMWTTDAHLEWALEVGRAWGFKYKTVQFVWSKLTSTGKSVRVLGPWGMKSCEMCLLFTRGKAHSKLLKRRNVFQFHSLLREEHSKKPQLFRDEIASMFSGARTVELFARQADPLLPWDFMGNELLSED